MSMFLAERSIIDLDGTLFIQLALFTLVFFILRRFVFAPIDALLEARQGATEGARQEAESMKLEALKQSEAFDKKMREAMLEASKERERLRQDGANLERSLLARVRGETQTLLDSARVELVAEEQRLRGLLNEQVPTLGKELAYRVLGRNESK